MAKYEYRVLPKQWGYGAKTYRYQTEQTFKDGIPFDEEARKNYRFERREVGEWEEVNPDDYQD